MLENKHDQEHPTWDWIIVMLLFMAGIGIIAFIFLCIFGIAEAGEIHI